MPPGIDESLPFVPIRIAVLTISDTRTLETDSSGSILAERIVAAGHRLHARRIVPDQIEAIRGAVRAWMEDADCDAVITTGGTGLTGRDVTPEAVEPLLDKVIDGFSVIFHQVSHRTVGPVDASVARVRRDRGRNLRLLPSGIEWRGERRLGRR